MDTTFWGPDGHKLNHSIAYSFSYNLYDEPVPKNIIISFFKSQQYILPCIYCRRSFKKYIKEIPIKKYIENNENKNVFKWMYLIHNKINDKLKKQGYLHKKNPSYDYILKKYKRFIKKISCNQIGWNFLYSVIFEYPQYDFELSKSRHNGYITFFTNLQYLLPCKKSRLIYQNYIKKYPVKDYMKTRDLLKKWLYRIEKKIKKKCKTYENRCKEIEKFRVSKCKNKSCRIKS